MLEGRKVKLVSERKYGGSVGGDREWPGDEIGVIRALDGGWLIVEVENEKDSALYRVQLHEVILEKPPAQKEDRRRQLARQYRDR